MSLSVPVIWSERHRSHVPGAEIWVGVRTPGTEVPERAERILAELTAAGGHIVDAAEHADSALLAVHDASLVEYLGSAWERWEASGLRDDPGQDRVVPYIFPNSEWVTESSSPAASAAARAGQFAYDTMTLIGPGTWEAVRAAADTALTAVDLVARGERVAYACTRPPGHHACRGVFGGSCYLNNAAIAAAALFDTFDGTVAVIDVDAHHGNGTQQIFYDDRGVLTGSVHVDPAAGWFPHFVGHANETGEGLGADANRNLCLAPGAGDEEWLAAVADLAAWTAAGNARALVVALGVDAAAGDPESPLEVSAEAYREAGRRLAELDLPTVIVQEGGYDLETIGGLVAAFLEGFESG